MYIEGSPSSCLEYPWNMHRRWWNVEWEYDVMGLGGGWGRKMMTHHL